MQNEGEMLIEVLSPAARGLTGEAVNEIGKKAGISWCCGKVDCNTKHQSSYGDAE